MSPTTPSGPQEGQARHGVGYPRSLLLPATILMTGTALIDFAITPGHLASFAPLGLLFALLGLVQVAVAVAAVRRPERRVLVVGALASLATVAIWLLIWTAALPFGPDRGRPQPIGVTDGVATAFGIVTVVLLTPLLALRWSRPAGRRRRWPTITATTLVAILAFPLTALGVLTGASPPPYAVNMAVARAGPSTTSVDRLREPPGSQPLKTFDLTAKPAVVDGHQVWAYNGTIPGPELRVTQGDRVRVTLHNQLPVGTSIHWHGLPVPDAEDGVVGVTQNAIAPGTTYAYEFVANVIGTYWYHAHQDTSMQVPRGLYGPLVIEPDREPHYDRDVTAVIGDLSDHDNDNQIVVNGATGRTLVAAVPGDLVRLRVVDAEQSDLTGQPELVTLAGARYTVAALDGHDLHQPGQLGPELIPLGVGQRADLVFRMPPSGQVVLFDESGPGSSHVARRESLALGSGSAPSRPDASGLSTFDLTSYGTRAPDSVASATHFDVSRDLRISNTHGFRNGGWENIHMINGKASPYADPIVVAMGQLVRLRFINETDESHPMHLHGHIMSVISKSGHPITGSPVQLDSVLVGPHETWEVAFRADNPGLWMLHCHVLLHSAFGLSTMVDYVGISTPYTIGTHDGNFPE